MSRTTSILAWAGLAVGLAACDGPQSATSVGDAKTDAAILAACRQRANEMYDRRNRAEIYAPQYGGNSPLSGTYTDVGVNRGLSSQFAFEQMVRDCVRTANVSNAPAAAGVPGSPPPGALPGAGTALPPPGVGSRR